MSDKAKSKSLEIEPLRYEGSIDDFRAWMDGFLSHAGVVTLVNDVSQEEIRQKSFDDWKKGGMKGNIINAAQYYPRLITTYSEIDQSSNREVWHIARYDPITDGKTTSQNRWATILAIQTFNTTTVQFLDGVYYRFREPDGQIVDYARSYFIGHSFSDYAQYIKDEWEKRDNPMQDEKLTGDTVISTKIPSVSYSGSVGYFRAWMDRFLAVNGRVFKISNSFYTLEYNISYFTPASTPTREVWNVHIDDRIVNPKAKDKLKNFGMILATEAQANSTTVEFIDGQCYQRTSQPAPRSTTQPPIFGYAHPAIHKPIGADFIKVAEWIKTELNKSQPPTPTQEPKTLEEWFDYYYSMKGKLKIPMEHIAEKTGYALSTIYKEHTLYKNRHEIRKKEVRKSKKK
jgi:hypothetical protein